MICKNCGHKPVCDRFKATGGVKSCEHHLEERRGEWQWANVRPKTYLRKCSVCGGEAYFCGTGCSYNYCPNCGADMRGKDVPGDCYVAGAPRNDSGDGVGSDG